MVNRELVSLFNTDSMKKNIRIGFDEGVITNTELHSQSFELTESLCSEKNLRFGCCEASSIKFKISNIFTPLKDKWISVTMTLNDDSTKKMSIGKYKVYSDVPTADRIFREVVAYDIMYDIINADVSDWYNSLTFPMTLLAFRNSFFAHFGITQESASLVNDGMTVDETIKPSELSGRDVITAICEINGVFGHIGRNGNFRYVDILKYPGTLYPSDDLFPNRSPDYLSQGDGKSLYPQGKSKNFETQEIINVWNYISCQYEDYVVQDITKLQIREKEGDIGVIYGEGDNTYIVQDNFLVYGKTSDELYTIASNLFGAISGAVYRPFQAKLKGCPCYEVGDCVQLNTKRAIITSYVLKRTLKGIQALKDEFSADGELVYPEKVNDIHTSIVQLKGKSNTLERTIEETKSTIADVETGLKSQITQTATEIRAEVEDTASGLSSQITQTSADITSTVSANYETKDDAKTTRETLESSIKQAADSIVLSVDANGKVVAVGLTADRKTGTTDFAVMADNISLDGKTINLTSDNIAINSTNFSVDKNGKVTAKDISITGGSITWSDIDTSGLNIPTSDDISSISKTTITKDYIETLNVKAGSVDAENITGTTISGKTISGGTVASEDIICHNRLYMQYKYGDTTGKKIPVLIMETATEPATLQIGTSIASISDMKVYPDTYFWHKVSAEGEISTESALRGNNIHANGGYYYATGNDGTERGVVRLMNSNNVLSCCLGTNTLPTVLLGSTVYLKETGGTIVSSDERLKNSFKSLEEFVDVYMDLEPCAFKYNNGTSDRYHFGLRAQNVENALLAHGYSTKDFAGFVQMQDSPESDGYCGIDDPKALSYSEFIPWNMHMIQKHEKEKKEFEFRISELENKISSLAERLKIYEQSTRQH